MSECEKHNDCRYQCEGCLIEKLAAQALEIQELKGLLGECLEQLNIYSEPGEPVKLINKIKAKLSEKI